MAARRCLSVALRTYPRCLVWRQSCDPNGCDDGAALGQTWGHSKSILLINGPDTLPSGTPILEPFYRLPAKPLVTLAARAGCTALTLCKG